MGVPLDTFEGHEGLFLTVVSAEGRHTIASCCAPTASASRRSHRSRRRPCSHEAQALLPAFKARFQRSGLMEPLTFLVRAPFETHPDGERSARTSGSRSSAWEDEQLVGKLVDGGAHTTEWRKGANVELEEEQINAIALGREGKTLDEDDMKVLLQAERSN